MSKLKLGLTFKLKLCLTLELKSNYCPNISVWLDKSQMFN